MGYTVIHHFKDLLDDDFSYREGDKYPRDGYYPSNERIRELSSTENKQGKPLIEQDTKQVTDDDEHDRRSAKRNSRRFDS